MNKYEERLNNIIKERREQNISIDDITFLYCDFTCKYKDYHIYIWDYNLKPFLKKQFKKRSIKDNFNKKLFSKILFNNLYCIRQNKGDLIPYGCNKDSTTYKYLASHQYIRRELEKLSIDDIMLLSWELVKRFHK